MKNSSKKEIEKVSTRNVSCEGSEAPYDHPKIYLTISQDKKEIQCPYCGKIFQYSGKYSK